MIENRNDDRDVDRVEDREAWAREQQAGRPASAVEQDRQLLGRPLSIS